MFDLAFYNMILKCYKIMGQDFRTMMNSCDCFNKEGYYDDSYYLLDNHDYLHRHIIYFTPRSGFVRNHFYRRSGFVRNK